MLKGTSGHGERRNASRTALVALSAAALAAALASTVEAQTSGSNANQAPPLPVRVLDRPTTLPRGATRLDVYALGNDAPGSDFETTGVIGGGWGVTNTFEIGGELIPFLFTPDVEYTNPSLYATYALRTGRTTSIAPMVQTVIPVRDSDPVILDVGAAFSVDIGRWGEFETAPTLSFNLRGSGTTFSVPLTLMRQAGRHVSWQIGSGIGFSRFHPRHWLSRRTESFDVDDLTVPAMAMIMYSVENKRSGNALLDFSLQGQFPQLYSNGPGDRGWETSDWSLQLQMSWYFVKSAGGMSASPAPSGRYR